MTRWLNAFINAQLTAFINMETFFLLERWERVVTMNGTFIKKYFTVSFE